MKWHNFKKCIGAVLVGVLVIYIPMQAAGYIQTKKVKYESNYIYYNGSPKYISEEPILIDGVTYLPVRAFGNLIGFDVDRKGNNAVLEVNTRPGYTSDLSLQQQLQSKDYQIKALKNEIENLKLNMGTGNLVDTNKDNYTQTTGTDIIGTELTATKKELERVYGSHFEGIDLDFDVRVSSKKLKVVISYDSARENDNFEDLYERDINNFVKEVCYDVRERHDDITIEGSIVYERTNSSDVTKYKFGYSKSNSISYNSYYGFDIEEIEDVLQKNKSIRIEGYNSAIDIYDTDVRVHDSIEDVFIKLYVDMGTEAITKWNGNLNKDYKLQDSLYDICEDIEDYTLYNVTIDIYQKGVSGKIATYYHESDELYKGSIK